MFSVIQLPLLILYLTGIELIVAFALLRTETRIVVLFVNPQLVLKGASMLNICISLNTSYTRISSKEYPPAFSLSVAAICPHCPQRTWKLVLKDCPLAARISAISMLSDFL